MSAPQFSEGKSPLSGGYLTKNQSLFKPLKEHSVQEKDFGLYHRIAVSSGNRVHVLITARSNTKKDALSKVAARLIKEGLPKVKLSHNKERAVALYRKELHPRAGPRTRLSGIPYREQCKLWR